MVKYFCDRCDEQQTGDEALNTVTPFSGIDGADDDDVEVDWCNKCCDAYEAHVRTFCVPFSERPTLESK